MVGIRPRPGKSQAKSQKSQKSRTSTSTISSTMSKEPSIIHEASREPSRTVPKTKVTTACDFCRRRKIRCDNGRPQCSNCRLYENECEYVSNTTNRGRRPRASRTKNPAQETSDGSSSSAGSYMPVMQMTDIDPSASTDLSTDIVNQPLSTGLSTDIVDQPLPAGLPNGLPTDIMFDMSLLSNTTATPQSWTSQLLDTASHSPQSLEVELALLYANSSPNLVQDPLSIFDPTFVIAPEIPPSTQTSSMPQIPETCSLPAIPASPPLTPRTENIDSYSRKELADIWYICLRTLAPCWNRDQVYAILKRQEEHPTKASTLFYRAIRWLCIVHLSPYGPYPKEATEIIHRDVMDALMDAKSHQDYVDLTGALVILATFLVATQGFRHGASVYFRLAAGTIERTVKDNLYWRLKSVIWMWDIIIHRTSGTPRCMDKLEHLKGWEEFQDEEVQVAPAMQAVISFLGDIDSLYSNQPVNPVQLSIQLQSRLKIFMDSIPDMHKIDKVSDEAYMNVRASWNVPLDGHPKNPIALYLHTLYHTFTIIFTRLLIPPTGPTNDHRRRMRVSAMQAMDTMSWVDADDIGKRCVVAIRVHEPLLAIIGRVFLDEAEARHEKGPLNFFERSPAKPFLPSLLVMLEWVKEALAISKIGQDPLPANIKLEQRIDSLFTSIGHEISKDSKD